MRGKQELKALLAFGLQATGAVKLAAKLSRQPWCILTYHRVVDPAESETPLQPGMFVRPETFEKHCRFLSENANVMPLEELVRCLASRSALPKRTVIVTFDDGWRDNYLNAFPTLRSFGVPATVFLATSYINTYRLFWTDELSAGLRTVWRRYRARADGAPHFALLEKSEDDVARAVSAALHASGNIEFTTALDGLIELLKKQDLPKRERIAAMLTDRAREEGEAPPKRQFMTWQEVREMDQAGVYFGSHTYSHSPLTDLNFGQIVEDLNRSKGLLAEHVRRISSVLCYPGGYLDEQTQRASFHCGYRFALTTSRRSDLSAEPVLLGRTGVHEDISRTLPLFAARLWMGPIFLRRLIRHLSSAYRSIPRVISASGRFSPKKP